MPDKTTENNQSESHYTVDAHEIMLRDKLRTESYIKAIENSVRPTDVVVDIGCGSGILSFIAARKGCKKVYAVDNSHLIKCAEEAARQNNLHHNIEFVKTDIMQFKPQEKIDLLIHEQIGNYIWDEDLVAKVKYIRDNFLTKTGRILPAVIDLYLVPSNYQSRLAKSLEFWSQEQYGIDFSNFSRELLSHNAEKLHWPAWIQLSDRKTFLCDEKLVHTVDLNHANDVPKSIEARFHLKKDSELTGICGLFTVHLDENTSFSTQPRETNTHWGQFFLPCGETQHIKQDSILDFTLFPDADSSKWKTDLATKKWTRG